MPDHPAPPPALDYLRMVHEALRDVPRQALAQVAEEGLPGEHHFVLAFKTREPDVRVPPFLRDLHPDDLSLTPPIPDDMGFLDWHRHRELFETAYRWTRTTLAETEPPPWLAAVLKPGS